MVIEMKNFINKYNINYRLQQLVILILHLILLRWMFYTLSHSGKMTMLTVMLHFIGMSLMGAGLIRGTAWWAQYHYMKEAKKEIEKKSEEKSQAELKLEE